MNLIDNYKKTILKYRELANARKINKFSELPERIQNRILEATKGIKGDVYLFGSFTNGTWIDEKEKGSLFSFYRRYFKGHKMSDIDIMIKGKNKRVQEGELDIFPFDDKIKSIVVWHKKE